MNIPSDKIIAYFQPILSADSKSVYSYEVLGRFIDEDGTVKSLGSFFNDPGTTNEDALQVDRIVRRYAMKKYAEEKRDEYLFINIRLAWLLQYANTTTEMLTLQLAKEFGIATDKLVIEITEEEFNESDACIQVISQYKNVGCRIALDDYGKNASNIDRLAKIKPDIIKIDMKYIHNSENSYHYQEYLRSIANFADSIGIEVLYEGVETQKQLDICMSLRGRYYQGFVIAKPQPSMLDAVVKVDDFAASIENSYVAMQEKIIEAEDLRKSMDIQIESFLKEHPFDSGKTNYSEYLAKLCSELKNVRLVYLCSRHGDQLTSNIALQSGSHVYSDAKRLAMYKNKNWVWRGYFFDALKAIATGQRSSISSAYHDFTTKDKVRTYSYAINDIVLLFADIDYI